MQAIDPKQGNPLQNQGTRIWLWLALAVGLLMLMQLFQKPTPPTPACFNGSGALVGATIPAGQQPQACTIDESTLKGLVGKHDQSIVSLTFEDSTVYSKLSNGWQGQTLIGASDATDIEHLADAAQPKVPYKQAVAPQLSPLWSFLISWGPFLALPFIWIFLSRRMMGAQTGGFGMFKSKAKVIMPGTAESVTFADVAGIDEAKADLVEVVEFLKDPQKFQRLGGRMPRGILLVGPPGTGKTLTAKAVAGEANCPFMYLSGSDFVEMFVGVGAARVRSMFEDAKKMAPCIIFIDELDALGRHRGAGLGYGNDEKEQTLNELLVQMDGFESTDGVMLIAATNRPDVLDPALLRSGRFDRQVVVPNPDVDGREAIIKVHIRRQKLPVAEGFQVRPIAQNTSGFSGADLQNLVNEAALCAARRNKKLVDNSDFDAAVEKMLLGPERRSLVMTEEEIELTSYHEAGHAIVSLNVKYGDPVTKVTRVPRGRALGVTLMQPERDRLSQSIGLCKDRLTVAMGGRAAEKLLYKDEPDRVTGGASGDIDSATKIATAMVTEWGMSDKLGPVKYSEANGDPFLGRQITQQGTLSEKYKVLIDGERQAFIEGGLTRAEDILRERWDEVDALAKALIADETLSGVEVRALCKKTQEARAAKLAASAASVTEQDETHQPANAVDSRATAGGATTNDGATS